MATSRPPESHGSPRFLERLPLPRWVRALGGGILVFLMAMLILVVAAAPRPLPLGGVITVGVATLLGGGAGIIALLCRQETEVRSDELRLRMRPVWRRHLDVAQLCVGETRRIQGFELGGFGVRRPGDGTTAVIANPGTALELTDERAEGRWLVRTDRPDQLASALSAARERATRS